ncbi:MAG: hypothetical protein HPY69_14945 [Armatimonadetes bacterium]|nr:hypothetical protein [Armatimonadota bacterium]
MLESSAVLQSLVQAQDGTSVLVLVPNEDLSAVATVEAVRYLGLATVLRADARGLSLDREALVHKLGKGRPRSTGKVIPFEAPGLNVWERLTIEFRDDETVVVMGGGRQEPLTFVEMGFGDGRSKHPRPDSLWRLLRQLACANGLLDWDRLGMVGVDQRLAPRRFSDLRKRLKAFFPGIAGEPIKPYSPKRGYETAFVARVSDEYLRRLLSQSDRAAR